MSPSPLTRSSITVMNSKEIALPRIATIGQSMVPRFFAHSTFRFVLTLRPCVLGFLTLALAVAAWGFGYKISLYQPNSRARSIVAKLWDKQRDAQTKDTSLAKAKFSSGPAHIAEFVAPDPRQCPGPAIAFLATLPRVPLSIVSVEYHLPFRSPPFRTLA